MRSTANKGNSDLEERNSHDKLYERGAVRRATHRKRPPGIFVPGDNNPRIAGYLMAVPRK